MKYRTEISKTYSGAGSFGLLVLRVIPFILLIVFHGWSKLMGATGYLFEGKDWMFIGATEKLGFPYAPYFAIAAALAESLFAFLIIIGLLTRFSAAIVSFNFMVAVYSKLIGDFQLEMAALYLAPALALVFLGAGSVSIDALFRRRPVEEIHSDTGHVKVYDPATADTHHHIEVNEDTEIIHHPKSDRI